MRRTSAGSGQRSRLCKPRPRRAQKPDSEVISMPDSVTSVPLASLKLLTMAPSRTAGSGMELSAAASCPLSSSTSAWATGISS